MNIVPLNYKGEIVSFNTDGWINVTGVAERFGKRIDNWMRLAETLEYVRALDEALTGKESQILHPSQSRYVKTSKARKDRGGGTWLHPKLSVAFARWCDARFAVWCDLHIDSLLRGELTEQQKYEQACRIRDDRKSKASNGAREMARWRWDKPVIEANVEYWREQLQLTLDIACCWQTQNCVIGKIKALR
ncbi:KilA-N domain-containing protein [Escherichia coli]|nr:KilA-N domain-containing protein [Escherichia coli]